MMGPTNHRGYGHEPGGNSGLRQAGVAHRAGRTDPAARHLEAEDRARPDRGHGRLLWPARILRLRRADRRGAGAAAAAVRLLRADRRHPRRYHNAVRLTPGTPRTDTPAHATGTPAAGQ